MALKFEIVQGNLKITSVESSAVILLFAKKDIGCLANVAELEENPKAVLFNINVGYNGIIFTQNLSDCQDSGGTPFTPETFLLFCELNLGFNSPGASGGITVTNDYTSLPLASTVNGEFYWCENTVGTHLTGLYYSNGTTWETNPADDITVVANYAALPNVSTAIGKFYWCSASQGTKYLPGSIGGTYYSAGMYYSNGTTWEFLNVPYQATQAAVDAGTITDQFVTPNTLANSVWIFTTAKVLATLLTGITFVTTGTIVSTDSILVAFGKAQKQINDLGSSLSNYVPTTRTINSKALNADVSLTTADISENTNLYWTTARGLATLLTGITFVTTGTIVSTDSILVAFGKAQKQINDLGTSLANYVPITRTINSKALNADVSLTTADVSDSSNKRYQTDAQQSYNDAISSIQTQLNGKASFEVNDITISQTNGLSPANSTTYFFSPSNIAGSTTEAIRRWKFPYAKSIKSVSIFLQQSLNGSSENISVYLRNSTASTETLIGTFQSNFGSSTITTFNFTGLNIAIPNTSDFWTLKIVTPAFTTSPTNWQGSFNIISQ